MKTHPVGAEFFHADRRKELSDFKRDMSKLIAD